MTPLYDGMLHTHSNAYGNFEKKNLKNINTKFIMLSLKVIYRMF